LYKPNPTRTRTISEIIFYVELLEIRELPGWDDINFRNIRSLKRNKDLSDEELLVLLESLQKIREIQKYETYRDDYTEDDSYEESWWKRLPELVKNEIDDWETVSKDLLVLYAQDLLRTARGVEKEDIESFLEEIDQEVESEKEEPLDKIAMINKYMCNSKPPKIQLDESWRKFTPKVIKTNIKDWNSAPIESVYEQAKTIMESSTGKERGAILPFVVELSQIIFENQEERVKSQGYSDDEISDLIMSRVEMVILPHLEMLDIISQRHGEIPFSQLDDAPYTDSLKKHVIARDEQKCVICEAGKDLHVQQKIPLDKGGINHEANLVTLCSSCQEAIKTANVQYAFERCLANYKKHHNPSSQEFLSQDIEELKEEVEKILDRLIIELENLKQDKLTKDVIDVKKRLEIIYYA
jgi:hypothetical protein